MATTDPAVTTIGPYEVSGPASADGGTYLGRRLTGAVRGRLYQLHVVRLSKEAERSLQREIERSAGIKHPAISPVVDFFPWQQRHVLVFEHVDGITLSRLLRYLERDGERLPDGAIWYLGLQVVGALARAHAATDPSGAPAPVVHGRFGPEHILVSWEGRVLLVGLGLPTLLDATRATGSADPNPVSFAAPEIEAKHPGTPAADAYSASLVLWTLLAGRWPPEGRERLALVREVRHDVPDTIAAAIDLSLEPSPGLRKVRCVDLERELRRVANVAVGKAELRDAVEMIRALLGLWSVLPPPVAPAGPDTSKAPVPPPAAPRPSPSTRPLRSSTSTQPGQAPSAPGPAAGPGPHVPPVLTREATPSAFSAARAGGGGPAASRDSRPSRPGTGSRPDPVGLDSPPRPIAGQSPSSRALARTPARAVDDLAPPASLSDLTATDVPPSPADKRQSPLGSAVASPRKASAAGPRVDVGGAGPSLREPLGSEAAAVRGAELGGSPNRAQTSAPAQASAPQTSASPKTSAPQTSTPAAPPLGPPRAALEPDASERSAANRSSPGRGSIGDAVAVETVPAAERPASTAPVPSLPEPAAAALPTEAADGATKPAPPIPTTRRGPRLKRVLVPAVMAPVALAAGLWIAWDAGLFSTNAGPPDEPTATSRAPDSTEEPPSAATTSATADGGPSLPGSASAADAAAAPAADSADAGSDLTAGGGAAPSPEVASGGGDGSELLSYEGYLIVRSTAQAEVFVQGKHVGPTNTRLVARCHQKFVRIGTLPGPTWLSNGVGVRIACRSVTEVTIQPER